MNTNSIRFITPEEIQSMGLVQLEVTRNLIVVKTVNGSNYAGLYTGVYNNASGWLYNKGLFIFKNEIIM